MSAHRELSDTHIGLAHGNGGRLMRELIEGLFVRHLANPWLDVSCDAVPVPFDAAGGDLIVTTDGFTVEPLEFPGGNIGSLAVHGTVNDLAVSGADPLFLTVNAFIEEGFAVATLERIVAAMAAAAREASCAIVGGDTKVVRRGEGGGLYLATTGLGQRPIGVALALDRIAAGDRLLISGPIGDHGTAVMLAREQFGLRGALKSDAASVLPITRALRALPGIKFMRDPTRGGLATVATEICRATGLAVRLDEVALPIRGEVLSVCELLGYDPLYLACEGRVLAVVAAEGADAALAAMRQAPGGEGAALIGSVSAGRPVAVLVTELGGERVLDELEDDPLPRIC
jgi:hydrogenase expression/formation protein HypE